MKKLDTGEEQAPVLSRDELESLDKKSVEVGLSLPPFLPPSLPPSLSLSLSQRPIYINFVYSGDRCTCIIMMYVYTFPVV